MHPEVQQSHAGHCPKCGMDLVIEGSDTHKMDHSHEHEEEHSYRPLIVILSTIIAATIALTVKDFQLESASILNTIRYFMIGFFLTFASFKLMDLKGFAQGYSTYDLLARKWFNYGYLYPFIELFFGLGMIVTESRLLLITELILMSFSGLGVAIKLAKKEKFQCACLGTFLKVPLTKITLIEDFGMALLALLMLILG